MAIYREDSQQTTATLTLEGADGTRKQAVSVSCHIRPGRAVNLSVDVMDDATLTDANRAEVTQVVQAILTEGMQKAAALGVPVQGGE